MADAGEVEASVGALRKLAQDVQGIAGQVRAPTEFMGVVGQLFPSNFKESQDLIVALRDSMGANMNGWSDGLVGGLAHNANITNAFANDFSNLDDLAAADLRNQTNRLGDSLNTTNTTTPRTPRGPLPAGAQPAPIDGLPPQPVQTQPTDIYAGEAQNRLNHRSVR